MTRPYSTRRRADEFEAALSRPLTEQDARDFVELLAVVRDLRAIPAPTPRADYVADLRSRLMAEADTALLPQAARSLAAEEQRLVLPARSHRRDRRLATALGAAALIGATTSMAVASQTTLPGESLYPIKRALEDAESGIARSDTDKGQALLAHARGRLDEIADLAERGDPASVSAIDSTLQSFGDQADEAADALLAAYDTTGDEAVITDLRSFTGSSMDRLSALEASVPASAHDSLVAAGERLADIDRQAAVQCRPCGGPAASIPPNLLSGANVSTDVTTVIVAASRNPGLHKPVRTDDPGSAPSSPASPDPVSGQDVTDMEVPDLEVPDPTATATPTDQATSRPGTAVDVKQPANEVTKLLTGDLSTATEGLLPVTNQVLTGVGTTLDGTVDGLQGTVDGLQGTVDGTVDGTTGSLLP